MKGAVTILCFCESPGTLVEDRKPCPNCGSTGRDHSVTLHSRLAIGSAINQLAEASPGDVQKIAASQIKLLTSYYDDVLAQTRKSFNLALIAAGVGLVFFIAAVGSLLIVQTQPVAVVSVISGALVEVIAGINFVLYSRTTSQLAVFHQHLDQTQRFLLANSICESLEGEVKQTTRASLINTIANPAQFPISS